MNDSDLIEGRTPETAYDGPATTSAVGANGTAHTSDATAESSETAAPARPVRRRASRPAGVEANTGSESGANGSAPPAAEPPAAEPPAAEPPAAERSRNGSGGALSAKLLPELQQIAGGLGVSGVGRLRKGQLIAAIQEARGATSAGPAAAVAAPAAPVSEASGSDVVARTDVPARESGPRTGASDSSSPVSSGVERRPTGDASRQREDRRPQRDGNQNGQGSGQNGREGGRDNPRGNPNNRDRDTNRDGPSYQNNRDRDGQGYQNRDNQNRNATGSNSNPANNAINNNNNDDDDDGDGRGRARRGRYRDRRRGRDRGQSTGVSGGVQNDTEPQIREDDVLAPVAGILDTADNYAFLRTSGYLAGPSDVYVSMNLVRRYGLRRGDALTGVVKANASESEHQGSRREKYNPLVRLDTINGIAPEEAKQRPEFTKLVPLYPQDRLRLETEPTDLVTRVIDLVMPIGKGQRALIVSPPKAGKTTVLQRIANAITVNNPECHLMVVLVDERPEEVTDMQRSVKGEVIASTFDRPAQDHTTVAELSIERAKRLVEQGHDVVVLLDSITRLGRAYNLAAPASGRILSGGVDSTALYPPKRFLGAARNIENGGSLTIIATALVETGSMMDTVIFEEFKGTGNAELKLDRKIADKRVFPAVDIDQSSTRKDELLLSREEMAIVLKLRRVLHSLDGQAAIELLMDKLKHTRTNIEFLMQIAQTAPGE